MISLTINLVNEIHYACEMKEYAIIVFQKYWTITFLIMSYQGWLWELWGLGRCKKNEAFYLFKEKNHWKITLDKVCVTKLLIKLLYLIFSNKSYSIDNMGNIFCDTVGRKYDFYNFNFEKLLSMNATVTSIINNILYAIDAFGKQFKSLIN